MEVAALPPQKINVKNTLLLLLYMPMAIAVIVLNDIVVDIVDIIVVGDEEYGPNP